MSLYLTHPAAEQPQGRADAWTMRVSTVSPLTVQEDGGPRPLRVVNGVPDRAHAVGDRVVVRRLPGAPETLIVTEALEPRPQFGTVTSVNAAQKQATVAAAGKSWVVQYGAAPAMNDRVAILWGAEGGVVVAVVSTATAPPPDGATPIPSTPPGESIVQAFGAAATASYRSGARRTDTSEVRQGHWTEGSTQDNTGLIVYGDVFGGVRGRTVDRMTVRLYRLTGSGVAGSANAYVYASAPTALPATTPALVGSPVAVPIVAGGDTTADITSLGTHFASGAANALAIFYAGTTHYLSLSGPTAARPDAGSLTITYH